MRAALCLLAILACRPETLVRDLCDVSPPQAHPVGVRECRVPVPSWADTHRKWAVSDVYGVATGVVVIPLSDSDGDARIGAGDAPDLLVSVFRTSDADASLLAVRGSSGDALWQVDGVAPYDAVAADLDADGSPEILTLQCTDGPPTTCSLVCFDVTGMLLWRAGMLDRVAGITVTDLDGDGLGEVIAGDLVVDATGMVVATLPVRVYGPYQRAVVADVDLDGFPEILADGKALAPDGTVRWVYTPFRLRAPPLVVQLDDDPEGEVVIFPAEADTSMRWLAFEHDGVLIAAGAPPAGERPYWGGYPLSSVASLDGDGRPDILASDTWSTYVLSVTADGLMSHDLERGDLRSTFLGLLGRDLPVDLDGDGQHELLRTDYSALVFTDGSTADREGSTPTLTEEVGQVNVAVDLDLDGATELLTLSGGSTEVYEQWDDAWPASRPTWSSWSYQPSTLYDDLSVASATYPWWLHEQVMNAQPILRGKADLEVEVVGGCATSCRADDGDLEIVTEVRNVGERATLRAVDLAVYTDDAEHRLLARERVPRLESGTAVAGPALRFPRAAVGSATRLVIVIDDGDAVHECDERANEVAWEVPC